MNEELKIPDDLKEYYVDAKRRSAGNHSHEVQLIERIAKLEALVSEYRSDHAENLGCNLYTRTAVGVKENDCRCDSCRRADELKG